MNKIFIALVLISTCCTSIKQANDMNSLSPVIIYKTKSDYVNNIPVILNSTKDRIISYPAVSDIYINGILALPTKLKNGYLLDNRGINENVAFTSFTYKEYSQLEKTPSTDILFEQIIDKAPLIEFHRCNCKKSYKSYNKEIRKGFNNCKSKYYE